MKVSGPAAWGTTERPELTRYDRLPLGLRIRPGPIETSDEPPERTFIYHLRPSRAGEAVLPPISIASFDPALSRYMTQVTPGVPVRVVAVSAFDPATIDDGESAVDAGRSVVGRWTAWSLSAVALAAASVSLMLVRRRLRRRQLAGECRGPAICRASGSKPCVRLILSPGRRSRVQPLRSRHTTSWKGPITAAARGFPTC